MRIRTFVVAALLATSAFVSVAPGGAPMGPPTAYLGEGQWAVGGEYGYGQMNLTASGTVTEQVLGGGTHWWTYGFRMDDLASNMAFGTLAYGLGDNWDIFARLGAADAKDKLVLLPNDDGPRRDRTTSTAVSDSPGAWERATFCRTGPWSFGGLMQITWFRPGESNFAMTDPRLPDESWGGDVKLNYWQAPASLAAAYQADKWRFWAGPFLQFVRGDMDFSGGGAVDGAGISTIRWTSKLQEPSQIGGHFGADWEICDQFNLWVEGQITGDSWLVGIGGVFIPGKAQDL